MRPRSSKTTVTKEKEGEKERVRRRKGGREKKAMVALFVLCPKITVGRRKVHLAITF